MNFIDLLIKKLDDLKVFDIKKYEVNTTVTEYMVVASGTSTRHISSSADNLIDYIQLETGIKPLHCDTKAQDGWVVIDYNTVIIHLFTEHTRLLYSLDDLYSTF